MPGIYFLNFSSTKTMNKSTTHTNDHNVEHYLKKITNWHYVVILGDTLQKEDLEKEL